MNATLVFHLSSEMILTASPPRNKSWGPAVSLTWSLDTTVLLLLAGERKDSCHGEGEELDYTVQGEAMAVIGMWHLTHLSIL